MKSIQDSLGNIAGILSLQGRTRELVQGGGELPPRIPMILKILDFWITLNEL